MADDIDELLDEVESKFISSENVNQQASTINKRSDNVSGVVEELDAAIHSICSIPDTGPIPASQLPLQFAAGNKRRCTVVFVGGTQNTSPMSTNPSHRRNIQKKLKPGAASKLSNKRYFAKPVYQLSVKDLEVESARRKQKEVVETLFEKKLAVVTDKMILDVRKFKRIKSDVWSNFGDVRLLISQSDAKKYNIDHHIIHIADEEMLLCKSFVACVKCSAVFSYESHSYGTSTLRSHLKSCGKPRYNMKEKKYMALKQKRLMSDIVPKEDQGQEINELFPQTIPSQEKVIRFKEQITKLQNQILMFFISKLKPFNMIESKEFKNLMQMFIQIGAAAGNVDVKNFLCSQTELADVLIQQAYSSAEIAFRSEVEKAYGVCFSAEVWLDVIEKASFVSLTCHYASQQGALKSVVMLTSEFPYENKTDEDMTSLLSDCIRFMNLENTKKLLVVDYSYNMVTAVEKDYRFTQCICYSVSRAVQTVINQLSLTENEDDPFALPGFASLINQCRSLVLHFKENKLQQSLPKHLVMCVSTCWKSTLKMLQSINNQWDHVMDLLNERGDGDLFGFDQESLSLVVDFLEIFHDGCEELSSISNPTINIVIPWLTKWRSHCLQSSEESPFLAALKSHMSSSVDEEVVSRITIYHKLATMLDPRFKELQFLTSEDQAEANSQAVSMVSECKEAMSAKLDDEPMITPDDKLADLYSCTPDMKSDSLTANEEVDKYLAEYFVMGKQDLDTENKFNPLKYWVRNQSKYPCLSKVALWLLTCPASAVRDDDAILASNWMINIKEIELPLKNIHSCLFLKSYRGL